MFNECIWKSDEKLLSFASKILIKNTPLRVVFSTLFSVFHLVMKHCVSCLIYYIVFRGMQLVEAWAG